MGRVLVFTVPGDVYELSPNQRLHWRERHKLTQAWKERAYRCWSMVAGDSLPFEGKVRISFTVYRGRQVDECNLYGSLALKAIIDGISESPWHRERGLPAMLPDDSPKWLERGTVGQVTGQRWKPWPEVNVIVEEME
jgi:hypothetical protein